MSSHSVSIQVPFEERLSPSKQFLDYFLSFAVSNVFHCLTRKFSQMSVSLFVIFFTMTAHSKDVLWWLMPWKSRSILCEVAKSYLVLCLCVTRHARNLSNVWLYKLIILTKSQQWMFSLVDSAMCCVECVVNTSCYGWFCLLSGNGSH